MSANPSSSRWRAAGIRTSSRFPRAVVLASIAIARDDGERPRHESIVALDKSRGVGDLQVFYTAVACRAVALLESGNEEAAGRLVSEFIEHLTGEVERTGQAYTPWLERLTLAWLSLRFGHADDLADLLARDARPVGSPWAEMASPWAEMMRPMLQGDLLTAASRAEEHLLLPDAAWLRLQAARGGDMSGLDQALDFYRRRAQAVRPRGRRALLPPRGCRAAPARARSPRTAP